MNELRSGFQAVKEQIGTCWLYAAFAVTASVLTVVEGYLLEPYTAVKPAPVWTELVDVAVNILRMAIYATGQAIAFSRFGKKLDAPVWRMESDWAAVRAFFSLWFAIDLVCIVLWMFAARLASAEAGPAPAALAFFAILGYAAAMTPIGACIMFVRPRTWQEAGRSLRPLANQAPAALIILFFSFASSFFLHLLAEDLSKVRWALPAADLAAAYFDCVVFAATWFLCRTDREQGDRLDIEF